MQVSIFFWVILQTHLEGTVSQIFYLCCTKPLSTIQCNRTLCRDQLVPILLIG